MVSVLTSSAVDHGFEHRLGKTKDYKIGSCCFLAKHIAFRRKSKGWLAWNQDNVFDWKIKEISNFNNNRHLNIGQGCQTQF